ncbi:MAG: TetR family transcriptional regulator [Pseudonocardiaceae bacterium]|nr:TetR family transcriptional regulator [Pseudonocardiaceae bacterium]
MALRAADPESKSGGRDRILRAAYELFCRFGTRGVGVDTVVAKAKVAKMTLYRHFATKDDLILATLQRREQLWTREWLQDEVSRRADTPAGQMLAVFDVFGEWFAAAELEGCTFINTMIEFEATDHPVRLASVQHLANIRNFLRDLAAAAGVDDPDGFSRKWHILMKGSIISAMEGDRLAARRAQEIGELLLERHAVAAA